MAGSQSCRRFEKVAQPPGPLPHPYLLKKRKNQEGQWKDILGPCTPLNVAFIGGQAESQEVLGRVYFPRGGRFMSMY